ncbi:MAG: hypothetical protein HC866_22105 [Leptolyngbyaceae cyanobacterium RU_5_1]|nr:hypothetical protein [Leptolyngbyaceae cyanobacterium RU_5_1]
MKRQFLLTTSATLILTVIGIVSDRRFSSAQSTKFTCLPPGAQFNQPVTMASTARGDFPIILWSSQNFEHWTNESGNKFDPTVRCEMVSRRFQSYYDCDLLDSKHIAVATIPLMENGKTQWYPAVLVTELDSPKARQCASLPSDGANVSSVRGLLFMLPPQGDIYGAAEQVRKILNQLDDVRFPGDETIEPIRN